MALEVTVAAERLEPRGGERMVDLASGEVAKQQPVQAGMAMTGAPGFQMGREHRPLRLHALVWIDVLRQEPPRRWKREVEGEARAGPEVLARGDEQRFQISAGGHQRHRVARCE